eukprot:g6543.t1
MVAATASATAPGSRVYSLQGGGSGMETKGDYMENKIARGVYGAFGAAADEAKQANKVAKDAANKAAKQARDSVQHVKDAAKSARDSVHIPSKIGWPFEDKVVEEQKQKLSWIGGATKKAVTDERHAVCTFIGNPNNAFVAQGVVALVFGLLHLAKYDEFVGKLADPLCKLVGLDWAAGTLGPHMKLVGAYLAGVFLSDMLAYKSNSAGFKRGKIWHEMGTSIAISAVCIMELLGDKPADIAPHTVAAVLFAAWYTYLSQQY